MWAIIATWAMSYEAIVKFHHQLKEKSATFVLENIINDIEDFPYFKSVGYGGLPNCQGEVELDAGYMNGTNFDFGAVIASKNIKNPISVAIDLSKQHANCVLAGEGVSKYALIHGFEFKNMLSDRAKIHYRNKQKELQMTKLKPYDGHDTVGVVVKNNQELVVGTSTSGLFMKLPGRVGDSPIIGSGFYADAMIGGASATGLGEDLMKGLVSYDVVSLLKQGYNVQQACEKVVLDLEAKFKSLNRDCGDISLVALDKDGNMGVATNIDNFSFVYASSYQKPTVYLVNRENNHCYYEEASQQWINNYMQTRMEPLE